MAQTSSGNLILDYLRMRVAVFRQTPDQVFKRQAGDRSLTGPYPVRDEAQLDWQFALLSVAAYGRSNPKRPPVPAGASVMTTIKHMWKHKKASNTAVPTPDVDVELNQAGWRRWSDFPDPKLEHEMEESHLRAEVWENAEKSAIAVAFGGTVFTSGKDWTSNFRWFIPWHKDEYTEIVARFGPDFVTTLANRAATPAMAYLSRMTIYSTGHSLGGGLAQQFAYAIPMTPLVQRVSQVYAFDPSPVTGYFSVDRATRESNRIGLGIGRIYERGEILATLRSFTSLIFKPSSINPAISGARFSLFYSIDPIAGHSMDELASKMRGRGPEFATSIILDRSCARRPYQLRPGRENAAPAKQENSDAERMPHDNSCAT